MSDNTTAAAATTNHTTPPSSTLSPDYVVNPEYETPLHDERLSQFVNSSYDSSEALFDAVQAYADLYQISFSKTCKRNSDRVLVSGQLYCSFGFHTRSHNMVLATDSPNPSLVSTTKTGCPVYFNITSAMEKRHSLDDSPDDSPRSVRVWRIGSHHLHPKYHNHIICKPRAAPPARNTSGRGSAGIPSSLAVHTQIEQLLMMDRTTLHSFFMNKFKDLLDIALNNGNFKHQIDLINKMLCKLSDEVKRKAHINVNELVQQITSSSSSSSAPPQLPAIQPPQLPGPNTKKVAAKSRAATARAKKQVKKAKDAAGVVDAPAASSAPQAATVPVTLPVPAVPALPEIKPINP